MKKIVLTSICTLAVAGAALAQGNVNWSTISFTSFTAVTNSTTYSPLLGGGPAVGGATGGVVGSSGFYFELLYTGSYNGSTNGVAPTTLTALGTWSDTGLGATNTGSAGRIFPEAANNGATINGMNPGTTNYIELVGWSANLGTNWSQADSHLNNSSYLAGLGTQAFFGISNIGYITPLSSSTTPGAAVFGTAATAQGLPIYSLLTPLYLVPTVTPEPGTMALAAIGGASLLLFRRRK